MKLPSADAPQLTWPGIAAGLLVATALSGAAWTLFQSQFSYVEKNINQNRNDMLKEDDNLNKEIKRIDAELLLRRSEFVSKDLFKEMERLDDERYHDEQERLRSLEQSRPTTGELKAIADSTRSLVEKLDERIRSLENFVRQPPKLNP